MISLLSDATRIKAFAAAFGFPDLPIIAFFDYEPTFTARPFLRKTSAVVRNAGSFPEAIEDMGASCGKHSPVNRRNNRCASCLPTINRTREEWIGELAVFRNFWAKSTAYDCHGCTHVSNLTEGPDLSIAL